MSHCLEPDPAKRYQTTVDLAAALEQLDDNGELIPVRRVFGVRVLAAVEIILRLRSLAEAGGMFGA